MIDLYELRQLTAFADLGTLSKVAEEFHISTPSVTRSMQHLEDAFGVPLFIRGKNRIELNDTGNTAVEYAFIPAGALSSTKRQRTILVKSCAPAPLWELLKALNAAQPEKMVTSAICQNDEVLRAWQDGSCDIAVLPFPIDGGSPFMQENLFVCVPKDHELATHKSLTFADINGFNFLLRTEIGFWDALCREKMPASKFLVQTDNAVFDELVRASSLPCFSTDYGNLQDGYPERVNIPLADEEAHVIFYLAKK